MTGKQLRNSILQWAIQGKLVPQDPNDEPASVLLERIRAEKARLVKEKKIKKDKNESIIYRGEDNSYYEKFADGTVRCIDDEIPFDIPQGWQWCRIKNICSMQAGKNISSDEIFPDKSDLHPFRCVGGNGLRGYVSFFNTSGHYAIVGRQGALCGCLNLEEGDFYATEHAVVVDSYEILSPIFLFYFLTALNLNQYATATAQPGLAVSNIVEVLFPLPPILEQNRIIEKLIAILPLVEEYDYTEKQLRRLNQNLIDRLRSSILQEAIHGRLVPQIESEGTAEELLDEIRAEKKQLVKEGKLKASSLKGESSIFKGEDNKYYEQIGSQILDISDEITYDIPDSWRFCRLGNVANLRLGKTPPRGEHNYWQPAVYPWVSIADMKDGATIYQTKEALSKDGAKLFQNVISPAGSLIMSFKLTIGKISILGMDAFHNEAIVTIRPYSLSIDWFRYFLPMIAQNGTTKDAIKGKTLNSKSLNALLIPLPPLHEQQRIIARIEEISHHL